MNLAPKKISFFSKDYRKILSLYKSSFPSYERFSPLFLRIASHINGISSVAFYDGGVLCAFAYFMTNEKTLYILFFAVEPSFRSKGIGSTVLSWIKEKAGRRTIFCDVEKSDENAPNCNQREERIKFYERNGFSRTREFFSYKNLDYEILSTDRTFTLEDYEENYKSYFRIFKSKSTGKEQKL